MKLNLNPDILSKLIQEAQALDENLYTPASYQKLTEQIEAALALLEKEDLTQEQIEAQLTALNAAVEGLIEKADKTKLQAKYDEAAAIENNNYPGWEALPGSPCLCEGSAGGSQRIPDGCGRTADSAAERAGQSLRFRG